MITVSYEKAKGDEHYLKARDKAIAELIAHQEFSVKSVLKKCKLDLIGSAGFRADHLKRMVEEEHGCELMALCSYAFTRDGRKAPAYQRLAGNGKDTVGFALVCRENDALVRAWHQRKENVALGVTNGTNKTRDYAVRAGIEALSRVNLVRQIPEDKLPRITG